MQVDVPTLLRIIGELTVKVTLYEEELNALQAALTGSEEEDILDA